MRWVALSAENNLMPKSSTARVNEGGGKIRMCPKARSIFHRGVGMRLEVFYKAFVGDDANFLEPIHFFLVSKWA